MTRARALKQLIRTRAARTGERYTAARRHVLRDMQVVTAQTQAAPPPAPAAPPPQARAKATISDASVIKKTGHDLAHWFDVLDRFGAVDRGHSAAAKHLYEAHQVDGWYSQGITVSYERARGVRVVNQRCDGDFEVSASKVMTASAKQVARALSDARVRESWITDADKKLADALAKGVEDKTSKGVVIRPDGLGRFRYKWGDTTVQFYMVPKPGGKLTVTVTQTKLANAESVETQRGQWKTALAALAGHFSA